MRVLEINSVNYGSTGSIMRNIAIEAEKAGIEAYTACQLGKATRGEAYHRHIYIGNRLDRNIHLVLGKLTGKYGTYSKYITMKFVAEIDKIKPDLIHIHNLHKGYINLEVLFGYIKRKGIPVVWTLHDCWSFTGQCPFFDRFHCNKWKLGCEKCPSYREYPSYIDKTAYMYAKKREWFTGVENMTIVTPSRWLAGLVKESFLKEYEVKVIHNGINLDIFKPQASELRKQYSLEGKKVILGVASIWDARKGLKVFLKLARELDDSFQIILIGLAKEQMEGLPDKIIGIGRTGSALELAQYYTMADVFLNPTYEDNFPTVNIEALACGTPVITFPTGGSAECLKEGCGLVVTEDKLSDALNHLDSYNLNTEACLEAGREYRASEKYLEYIQLYKAILG